MPHTKKNSIAPTDGAVLFFASVLLQGETMPITKGTALKQGHCATAPAPMATADAPIRKWRVLRTGRGWTDFNAMTLGVEQQVVELPQVDRGSTVEWRADNVHYQVKYNDSAATFTMKLTPGWSGSLESTSLLEVSL